MVKVTRAGQLPIHEDEENLLVRWVPTAVVGTCNVCLGDGGGHVLAVRVGTGGAKPEDRQYLLLCPEGERILLFSLLRGYISRKMSRTPKIGYNGPIPKPIELVQHEEAERKAKEVKAETKTT